MGKTKANGINLIRIISMSMILLFHARLLYGFRIGFTPIDNIFSIGAICVTVFFILSGFGLRKSNRGLEVWIHTSNSDEKSVLHIAALKTYLVRRLLSIYPLYLLLQLVAVLFTFRVDGFWENASWLVPVQLTMTQVLIGKDVYGYLFNDNCWYISALFILYLVFPLLNASLNYLHTRVASWDRKKRIFVLLALLVVMLLLSEGIYLSQVYLCEGNSFLDYYPNPLFRIPEFVVGMLVADLSEEERICKLFASKLRCLVVLGACFIIGFVGLQILFPYVGLEYNIYNIVVIPCTVLFMLCVVGNPWLQQIGSNKVVQWIAGMGLEMYLCQSFAILVMERIGVQSHHGLLFIVLSVIIAVIVHVGFSRNIKHFLKR